MRYLFCILLISSLPSFLLGAAGQVTYNNVTIPACVIGCIEPVLIDSRCDITSLETIDACLCHNITSQYTIINCCNKNCAFSDLITVLSTTGGSKCKGVPIPTRQPNLYGACVVFAILPIVFVGLRLWSRHSISKEFWWDDWLLVGSTISFWVLLFVIIWETTQGFGLHAWDIRHYRFIELYQFQWIFEMLGILVLYLTKVSILLLLHRVFPPHELRLAIRIGFIVLSINSLTFLLVLVFQCRPIAYVYDKTKEGTCLNINTIYIAGSAVHLVEDISLLCLPMPVIWRMRLNWTKKVKAMLVMGIGIIATIAAAVRLGVVTLVQTSSADASWNDFGVAVANMTELCLSIICVCLPAIMPLLKGHFPKYFRSSATGSQRPLDIRAEFVEDEEKQGFWRQLKHKASSIFTDRQSRERSAPSSSHGSHRTIVNLELVELPPLQGDK